MVVEEGEDLDPGAVSRDASGSCRTASTRWAVSPRSACRRTSGRFLGAGVTKPRRVKIRWIVETDGRGETLALEVRVDRVGPGVGAEVHELLAQSRRSVPRPAARRRGLVSRALRAGLEGRRALFAVAATRVETQAGDTPYFLAVARTPRSTPGTPPTSRLSGSSTTETPPRECSLCRDRSRSLSSEGRDRWDCFLKSVGTREQLNLCRLSESVSLGLVVAIGVHSRLADELAVLTHDAHVRVDDVETHSFAASGRGFRLGP